LGRYIFGYDTRELKVERILTPKNSILKLLEYIFIGTTDRISMIMIRLLSLNKYQ
jgi:hypothetical protein